MVGSIIVLGVVGLILIYGILCLFNFVYGDFMILVVYLIWWVNISGINLWLFMVLGCVGIIIVMFIGEWLFWKFMWVWWVMVIMLIIIFIGLVLFFCNGIFLIWGGNN